MLAADFMWNFWNTYYPYGFMCAWGLLIVGCIVWPSKSYREERRRNRQ